MLNRDLSSPVYCSIGIMAWNEESSILRTLKSLFEQSVFEELASRNLKCEVLCLANGCTDRTAQVAADFFESASANHPFAKAISARSLAIQQPGRNNTWNRFVHEFSAPETNFIYLMDADIVFEHPRTIVDLLSALENDPRACVASGRQIKDISFKKNKTLFDRISLATSSMTGTIEGRFSGQLYCMRSEIARNLFLPRDLSANDDGFFKQVICTDFLTAPLDPKKILFVPSAGHIYEAYIKPAEILNNQKRQMIGQTAVHVLLEYLKTLPENERKRLAETLVAREHEDPDWLKRKLAVHVSKARHFWDIFPGLASFRFKRLLKLKGVKRLTHFPAAFAGFVVTMISSWRAYHFLKKGETQFWPKAGRQQVLETPSLSAR